MMSTAALGVQLLPTPAGLLAVVVTPEDGVVRAAGFDPPEALVARLPAVLRERGVEQRTSSRDAVAEAITAYADGELAALDAVPTDQPGGPFLQQAWQAMRAVPGGTTVSYAELAKAAGRPTAVRAAGSACARNLVAPFVPCHRIVRSDGSLGGYRYGLPVKQRLLHHERRG